MWDPEHFPGADNVPWQLLIRARFTHQLDAVIASQVVRVLATVLPAKSAVALSHAATAAVASVPREKAGAEGTVRALSAYDDFWDWCGTKWPRPFPPRRFEDFSDPFVVLAIEKAREFVGAGSPELQKGLGAALDEVAGGFAR
ncbi:hypothetical protein [Protaetiibacter intestinalis]|uniref:Uncharacterized protein n=1 Tax=Protaetiibacter intestinalis TaxID=2419774 RepID=A0A387B4M0_9MICO|nr:hypothetical protein [Protaetiibacter intestinalis]AYF98584.1 hypothetical protein D7I47_10135 [Protaetiibacter intestinalis]